MGAVAFGQIPLLQIDGLKLVQTLEAEVKRAFTTVEEYRREAESAKSALDAQSHRAAELQIDLERAQQSNAALTEEVERLQATHETLVQKKENLEAAKAKLEKLRLKLSGTKLLAAIAKLQVGFVLCSDSISAQHKALLPAVHAAHAARARTPLSVDE